MLEFRNSDKGSKSLPDICLAYKLYILGSGRGPVPAVVCKLMITSDENKTELQCFHGLVRKTVAGLWIISKVYYFACNNHPLALVLESWVKTSFIINLPVQNACFWSQTIICVSFFSIYNKYSEYTPISLHSFYFVTSSIICKAAYCLINSSKGNFGSFKF